MTVILIVNIIRLLNQDSEWWAGSWHNRGQSSKISDRSIDIRISRWYPPFFLALAQDNCIPLDKRLLRSLFEFQKLPSGEWKKCCSHFKFLQCTTHPTYLLFIRHNLPLLHEPAAGTAAAPHGLPPPQVVLLLLVTQSLFVLLGLLPLLPGVVHLHPHTDGLH